MSAVRPEAAVGLVGWRRAASDLKQPLMAVMYLQQELVWVNVIGILASTTRTNSCMFVSSLICE